jgi:hypothetical protein
VLDGDLPAIAETMISLGPIRHSTSLASLALLALVASPARAQQPPAASPGSDAAAFSEDFKRADTNHDGKLSPEEAAAAGFFTNDSFDDVDEDHDGTVTLFELGDAMQKRLRQWSSQAQGADTNHDGFVSEEEAEAAGPSFLAIFKRVDRNGDHRIEVDKFDTYVHDSYYSETNTRSVVPNIINKKF